MEINIRRAVHKDIPEIMNLLGQVNDIHADGRPDLFKHGMTKYTESELITILENEATPVFVAVDENDKARGYCFCVVQESKGNNLHAVRTLYIDDLCVDVNCRGLHIGRRLYDHVRRYARQNGFHNITLNVWSCNPSAISFYESLGLSPYKLCMEERL